MRPPASTRRVRAFLFCFGIWVAALVALIVWHRLTHIEAPEMWVLCIASGLVGGAATTAINGLLDDRSTLASVSVSLSLGVGQLYRAAHSASHEGGSTAAMLFSLALGTVVTTLYVRQALSGQAQGADAEDEC